MLSSGEKRGAGAYRGTRWRSPPFIAHVVLLGPGTRACWGALVAPSAEGVSASWRPPAVVGALAFLVLPLLLMGLLLCMGRAGAATAPAVRVPSCMCKRGLQQV